MKLGKPSHECAARVMDTIPLLMRFIRADMRTHSPDSISIPQLRSLAFLKRRPGASLSEVADHLGVTCATASTTIERLVQRLLVQRTDNPQERRRIVLNLTPEGKHLLEQSQAKTRAHIAEILQDLTPEQISQIEHGLTLLKNVFEQTELSP
ncbi:MarR family winged helix-turn-helix transcriptional regulator [Nostoc sp. UHCC 0870]|jgi:DNA-binding MarR family transcriptional regulator|uniref:MarR family winged helix-turn-helix transcriptional regulator n=1 Tax=Nostoc sp. UHCC 0870 TaxID=2914041 RepID=UPI001EDCF094|nr:MarR family transcriptional regulator [Nostoc sp. UHCC 0870]UKO99553.1 MarR family transcriptional regulator [Nostoc sp. UHCC 0870]